MRLRIVVLAVVLVVSSSLQASAQIADESHVERIRSRVDEGTWLTLSGLLKSDAVAFGVVSEVSPTDKYLSSEWSSFDMQVVHWYYIKSGVSVPRESSEIYAPKNTFESGKLYLVGVKVEKIPRPFVTGNTKEVLVVETWMSIGQVADSLLDSIFLVPNSEK